MMGLSGLGTGLWIRAPGFKSGYDPSCRAGSFSVLNETAIALPLPQMLFGGSSQSIKVLMHAASGCCGASLCSFKINLKEHGILNSDMLLLNLGEY